MCFGEVDGEVQCHLLARALRQPLLVSRAIGDPRRQRVEAIGEPVKPLTMCERPSNRRKELE